MIAATAHDSTEVQRVLSLFPELANYEDEEGMTPLMAAIPSELPVGAAQRKADPDDAFHLATVRSLCQSGALPNERGGQSFTPLCLASLGHVPKIALELLAFKADVNLRMATGAHLLFGGWTPLMLAARMGNTTLCELYVSAGADGTVRTGMPGPPCSAGEHCPECPRHPVPARSTALDIACFTVVATPTPEESAATWESMLLTCCRMCGKTASNIAAEPVGPFDRQKKLRRCRWCPTRYCSTECQAADWKPRHEDACAGRALYETDRALRKL